MVNENKKVIELSKFALGEIYCKKDSKFKTTKINRVGYMIIENGETFVYDLVDNVVIDLYNTKNLENSNNESYLFRIVNIPWEFSNECISPKELDEVVEILKKRSSEYDSEQRKDTKYMNRPQKKKEVYSEYEIECNRKLAHQKRLMNTRNKQASKNI